MAGVYCIASKSKTEFYASHNQELQAYHSAAAKLETEGVDQSVEPEKVIALAEGVEQRIEELKAQMEEVNKQEEKIVKEQQTVVQIQKCESDRRDSEIAVM